MEAHPQNQVTPGWCGITEVDERFIGDWIAYGIAEFGVMLGNQARFDAWRAETGR